MDEFILGVYWKERPLTLRQYADALRGFLLMLRQTHEVFSELEWVGNKPNSSVVLAADLTNLDDIVYSSSWGKESVRGQLNPDGTAGWQSFDELGFDMTFETGVSSRKSGVTVSVHAGALISVTPDAVSICFPGPEDSRFTCRDFFDYGFLKRLFGDVIRYWQPLRGLVVPYNFARVIYPSTSPKSGWLTYFSNEKAVEVAREFPTDDLGVSGVVFTLGPEPVSAESEEDVRRGLRLRDLLENAGLI